MKRISLATILLATPVFADSQGYEHMMNWGHGYGVGMMFGPVLWLIVLGLTVAGVIWLVRRTDQGHPAAGKTSALAILDNRFAKGEIDAEEYKSRRELLAD